MNKQKLERHLRAHGCQFCRQGGRHEIWKSADGSLETAVPRHGEIKFPTARALCRDLNVPPPTEK